MSIRVRGNLSTIRASDVRRYEPPLGIDAYRLRIIIAHTHPGVVHQVWSNAQGEEHVFADDVKSRYGSEVEKEVAWRRIPFPFSDSITYIFL